MAIPQDGSKHAQPTPGPSPSTSGSGSQPNPYRPPLDTSGQPPSMQRWNASGSGPQQVAGYVGQDSPWYQSDGTTTMVLKNGGLMGSTKDPLLKVQDVMWRLYQWDQKKLDQLARKFGMPEGSPAYLIWRALEPLVKNAAFAYASDPNKAPTLDFILNTAVKGGVYADESGAASLPATQRHEQVNLSDAGSAHQLVDQILKQRLGRAATKAEKASFLAALNEEQRNSPEVTIQSALNRETGQYEKVTNSGGVNPQEFADEWVAGDGAREKEGRAYQLAGYFEEFVNGMGAIGGA